jgi:hypothetical protein
MNNIGSRIIKAFMWMAGMAALVYGVYALTVDTSNWPTTVAVVTSSSKVSSDELGTDTYSTDFEYSVDGKTYQGYVNDSTQYAEGNQITVYYDPNDPDTTVMSQGEMGYVGCIGVLFGLFAIGSMAWGAVKARKQVITPSP